MRHAIPLPALLLLALPLRVLPAADPVAADAAPVALIVAYQPFAGRAANGSATVAAALRGQAIGGHRVETLVLPVRWGEPTARLPEAVRRLRPALLLGLGEGWPGTIAVERVARNRAEGPDEDGRAPVAERLDAAGPDLRTARFAFEASWFAAPPLPVAASDDAGTYLCNALFYAALAEPVSRVGFVHLPPQGGETGEAYAERLLPVVRVLIGRNLAAAVAQP